MAPARDLGVGKAWGTQKKSMGDLEGEAQIAVDWEAEPPWPILGVHNSIPHTRK